MSDVDGEGKPLSKKALKKLEKKEKKENEKKQKETERAAKEAAEVTEVIKKLSNLIIKKKKKRVFIENIIFLGLWYRKLWKIEIESVTGKDR